MTKDEISAQLDELGIPYPDDATKADLETLLPAPLPDSPPVWEGGENRLEFQKRLDAWEAKHPTS